jgi:Tol biopolymer transport system component
VIRHILAATAVVGVAVGLPLLAQEQPASPPATDGLVLKAERTIDFTTDEVTWMSVDVSPDGQSIVFDLLGDLYTLPIGGGEARRIMGGLSFESQPTWSPDGRTIAFLSDRTGVENLWIADADGSNPRAVSKDGRTNDRPQIMTSPAWTPDGQYIVVSKSRPPDPGTFWLFMYHRDGGSGVRVGAAPPPQPAPDAAGPPPPPANRMGAVVSPDGRFIYYAQRTGTFTYNARFPLWQIHRHDRDTGDVSQVTNAQGSAMRPVLSPDGKWLVYATRYKTDTALRIRNLDTGAERWLVSPVTRDDQESRASRDTLPRYDFMPDGRSIVVPVAGKLQRVDLETGAATPIPFTARVQVEVAPRAYSEIRIDDGPQVRARLVRWPRVSPDGRRLAFSALNHLYLMDLPAGTPRRRGTPRGRRG